MRGCMQICVKNNPAMIKILEKELVRAAIFMIECWKNRT